MYSFCKADEVPLSPDDEVVIQNVRRGKRSTFELDQPTATMELKRPSSGRESFGIPPTRTSNSRESVGGQPKRPSNGAVSSSTATASKSKSQ